MKKYLIILFIAIAATAFSACKKGDKAVPADTFDYSKLPEGEDKEFTIACVRECREKGNSAGCDPEKIFGMKKDYYSPGTAGVHHLGFIEDAMKLCPATAEKRLDMSKPPFNEADLEMFYKSISAGDSAAVLKILKEKKASAVYNPGEYPCPIDEAARSGRLDILKLLLQEGAQLKKKEGDEFVCSPLFSAVEGGRTDIIEYLIQQGVPLTEREGFGETALHIAARLGNVKMVSFLISKGMSPDDKDNKGQTALDYARYHERKEVETFLIQNTGK